VLLFLVLVLDEAGNTQKRSGYWRHRQFETKHLTAATFPVISPPGYPLLDEKLLLALISK
jgi:hypothetical protein